MAASARRQVRGSQIGQPGQRRQGSHVPSHAGVAEVPEDGAKLGRQRGNGRRTVNPPNSSCVNHTCSAAATTSAQQDNTAHSSGNRGSAQVAASARRQVRGSQIGQPGQRRQVSQVPSHTGAAEAPEDGAKL